MEASAIIAIISVSATAGGAFITSLFHSLSLSRCSQIDCLCFKCKREVLSEETYSEQSNKIDPVESPKTIQSPSISFNQE
jgi:hypothetical protein|tara:strand:+ start:214 stop:453 length:240 start_codon:yes stop_codon:yes gene_type:complete